MRPLPSEPYIPAIWSPDLKVGNDYLVSDGLNKYSVPFDLIGEKVNLRLTRDTVEVFYLGSRVAMHVRQHKILREPVVKPEHMTPEHQKYLNYNAQEFMDWASAVGPCTETVVRYFLTAGKEAEQGYKSCASLTKLEQRYGKKRLEKACERLLAFTGTPSIRTLNSILKNGQDRLELATEPEQPKAAKQHGITRGAAYFRKGGDNK